MLEALADGGGNDAMQTVDSTSIRATAMSNPPLSVTDDL